MTLAVGTSSVHLKNDVGFDVMEDIVMEDIVERENFLTTRDSYAASADPEGPQTDLNRSDKLCKALDAAMNWDLQR